MLTPQPQSINQLSPAFLLSDSKKAMDAKMSGAVSVRGRRVVIEARLDELVDILPAANAIVPVGPTPLPTASQLRDLMEVHGADPEKKKLSDKQIQLQINSIQRSENLKTGMKGQWSHNCNNRLLAWMTKPPSSNARQTSVPLKQSALEKQPSSAPASPFQDGCTEGSPKDSESATSGSDSGSSTSSSSSDSEESNEADADAGNEGDTGAGNEAGVAEETSSSSSDSEQGKGADAGAGSEADTDARSVTDTVAEEEINDDVIMNHPIYEQLSQDYDELAKENETLKGFKKARDDLQKKYDALEHDNLKLLTSRSETDYEKVMQENEDLRACIEDLKAEVRHLQKRRRKD